MYTYAKQNVIWRRDWILSTLVFNVRKALAFNVSTKLWGSKVESKLNPQANQ